MARVKFDCTDEELELIEQIINRAEKAGHSRGKKSPRHWYERQTFSMDLIATNANGCPMDFAGLLAADDFNFLHDIAGIARHLDRRTGKIGGGFLPRFHRRSASIDRVA